jgi:hypothetical protein
MGGLKKALLLQTLRRNENLSAVGASGLVCI